MACGAVCTGFTGIGGREFATAENGFWVGEDGCEAAADALAEAAALAGPALEDAWMTVAPDARLKDGPLN